MQTVDITNHFATLKAFNTACEQDRGITAAAQLIYRLLIEEANRSRWNDDFICSMDYLEKITHYSRHTIIDARMRLKSKGFIDFAGNPSKYKVYSAVHWEGNRSGTPAPQEKTVNQTKKEKEQRKKGAGGNGNNGNNLQHNRANLNLPIQPSKDERHERLLAELREREERNRAGTRQMQ